MSERTHRILFEHAPVALWDVDVDQVAEIAAAIQTRMPPGAPPDAAAWAGHLAAHFDDLRALTTAVVVCEANRRALALSAGAQDATALLAHMPVASAARLLAAMAAGQRSFVEETTWRMDGADDQRVRLTFEALDDAGRARGLVGVVEIAATATPDSAVAQLERALASARAELSSFVYAASHDLQAPLRMVVSYTDLLKRRYGDSLDERALKYIDQAGEGGRQMRAMIDGLLALSRVFTRPRQRVIADLAALLAQAETRLRTHITETGARITHDALPTVTGDPVQIVQVLEQLLDNALKFHGAEPPAIHVSARRADDAWVVTISDNGIGMEAERLDAIFAPFQRLHPPQAYPGTGLGLTVVAKIVERHGGRVWATSQPGQGSTLHVSWPDSVS
jgi:signal transduction histidine kinase